MGYDPTEFHEGEAPGLSAAEMNKLGTQYAEGKTDLDAHDADVTDSHGRVAGILPVGQIPGLAASKIISGILAVARIPNLAASKITSGRFPLARLGWTANKLLLGAGAGADPDEIDPYTHPTTGTCPQAPKAHNQAASTITSGRFTMPRMPAGALNYVLTAKGAGKDPEYATPVDLLTLTDFRANAATGTAGSPANINNDVLDGFCVFHLNEYAEITLEKTFHIKEFRIYGYEHTQRTVDIQYWSGSEWLPLNTGVSVPTTAVWTDWTALTEEVNTASIRIVNNDANSAYIGEVQMRG